MEGLSQKACCEVYDIILHMEEELYSRIPKKIIKIIETNRDKRI